MRPHKKPLSGAEVIGPYSPWPRALRQQQAGRVLAAGSVPALALLLRHIFPLA